MEIRHQYLSNGLASTHISIDPGHLSRRLKRDKCGCSTLIVNDNLALSIGLSSRFGTNDQPLFYCCAKPTTISSTRLPDCFIFASIALFAYRHPQQIFLCPTTQHRPPQWLNTRTKWISSFGQSCHKLLKSCTTSLHLKVNPRSRSCSHTGLTKSLGANEVLLGLNTVESKVAYLIQIIAIELYKASKAISPKVRFVKSLCRKPR